MFDNAELGKVIKIKKIAIEYIWVIESEPVEFCKFIVLWINDYYPLYILVRQFSSQLCEK